MSLSDKIIEAELARLPNWSYVKEGEKVGLHRHFKFESFSRAIDFMVECRPVIDKFNHHPDWTNVYNTIHVIYRTHDAGNKVTEKDIKLAEILENRYQNGYVSK